MALDIAGAKRLVVDGFSTEEMDMRDQTVWILEQGGHTVEKTDNGLVATPKEEKGFANNTPEHLVIAGLAEGVRANITVTVDR